jgi:hypothetical protein
MTPRADPPTSAPSRRGARRWPVAAAAAAALLALIGLGVFLPLAFQEPAAAPAAPASARAPSASRPATTKEAQVALTRAAAALRAGDRAAYRAALPATSQGARHALGALFRHLSPLPWTTLHLAARPIASVPGRFDVFAAGRLGHTGPADRVGGERVLELRTRGGRVVAVADATPAAIEREYLMAFHDPVAVAGNGLLVVTDRRARYRAEELVAAAAQAESRLALVGVKPDRQVFVAVYSSLDDLKAALGGGPAEDRIRFFSYAGPRMAARPWRIRDIGVLGPSLDGTGAWMPLMLAHELTHAYTWQWFDHTEHEPMFLLDGLGTAVEGGRDWTPLKEEVAGGNLLWPLADAMAAGSLWMGTSTDDVRLAYLEAASVVHYVLDRWGLARLRPFMQAVADSDLTAQGLDRATLESLGVSWREFYQGWLRYVPTLR